MRTWLFMVFAWPNICELMFLIWWMTLCFCLIAQHKCMAEAWQWHFFAMTIRMIYCRQLCSFCLRVNAFCFKRGFLRITRHLAASLRCSRSRHLEQPDSTGVHSRTRPESKASEQSEKGRASPWCPCWPARWASVFAMTLLSVSSAACKGTVCGSCSFQPRLSVYRSQLPVASDLEGPMPEVNAPLGSESGAPLRSLLSKWRCSIAWQDLSDVRSADALLVPIWAETLVRFPSARLNLQPIHATCQGAFYDSRSFQPWPLRCRNHLLVECRMKRLIPEDLLGSVSGVPPCPLLGNRYCSAALPNPSDVRSVAALPAQLYWAVPSVRSILAGFDLQPIHAACRGPICAIHSTQPWLSVCRSHLLVDSDLEKPVTEVEALLETASGVQLCFLTGGWSCRKRIEWRNLRDVRPAAVLPVLLTWVTTPVHLPSTRLHLQSPGTVCKAALLGTESGAPPCPLIGIQCFRAVWQDSCDIRSVLAFPGLTLWSGFISGCLWPWPSAYRHPLLVVFASMRPISKVPTLLQLVSGVPPRPCWVVTLVHFSSIVFGVTPTGNSGGEPQWLQFAIRLQCRLHARGREGRSLLQQDVGQSMRRKARIAETLLKWHRQRKLVRSRGRQRLKLSQKRNRLPGTVPSRRLKPRQGHCLRVRAALGPPRQNQPLLAPEGPHVHEQLPVLVTPPPQAPLAQRLPRPAIRPSLATMDALWRRGSKVNPLMMLRVWTARRSQTASILMCCFSRERCHPLRGRPRHLLPLRVRVHSAVSPGAHIERRRCFAGQALDVRATLFLGRTAPTDLPSREIKYGGCAAMHMLADASVFSHVSLPVSLDVISRVQPSFDSMGRDLGGSGNFFLQASILPRYAPCYSWSAFVPFSACRPDCGSLGQPAQRSGHQLRAVYSLLSGLFVPLLPCDIDPGRGIRAAGPPSQNAVQCSLSTSVLHTTPADVAARVPLKRLLPDSPVYSSWGCAAMVKHRSWSTKQRSACRPGKKEREIIKTTTKATAKCAARAPTAVVIPMARIPPPPPAPPRRHPTPVVMASSPLHSNPTLIPHKTEQPCEFSTGDADVQMRLDALRGRLRSMLIKSRSTVDRPTFVTTQPLPCTEPNLALPALRNATGTASPSDPRHREAYMLLWLSLVSILWFCLLWSASQARRSGHYGTAPSRHAAHRLRLGLIFITLLLLGFSWHVGPHRDKLCPDHCLAMPSSLHFGGPFHVSGRRHAAICRRLYVYWWPRLVTIVTLGTSPYYFLPCNSTVHTPGLLWLGLCYALAMLALTVVASLLLQHLIGHHRRSWCPTQAPGITCRHPGPSRFSTMSGPKSGRHCCSLFSRPRSLLALLIVWAHIHAVSGVRVGASASQQAPGVSPSTHHRESSLGEAKIGTYHEPNSSTWHPVRKRAFRRAIARARRNPDHKALYRGGTIFVADDPKGRAEHAVRTVISRLNKRISIMTWNCGGLTTLRFAELKEWLRQQPPASRPQLLVLQETLWRGDFEWTDDMYTYLHSGSGQTRDSGILTMVSRSLCAPDLIRHASIQPGRLMRIKICLEPCVEVLAVYQHAWRPETTANAREALLAKRLALWHRVQRFAESTALRSQLIVLGDFNTPLSSQQPFTGQGLRGQVKRSQQDSLPDRKRHAPDGDVFRYLLQCCDLQAINTFRRSGTPCATFRNLATNAFTQIDFILVRRQQADDQSRMAAPARDFPLLPVEGMFHYPVVCSLPRAAVPRTKTAFHRLRPDQATLMLQRDPARGQLLQQLVRTQLQALPSIDLVNEVLLSAWRTVFTDASPTRAPTSGPCLAQLWHHRRMSTSAHTVYARWRHLVKYRAVRKALQARAVVAKRAKLQQQLHDAEVAECSGQPSALYQVLRRIAPKIRRRRMQLRDEDNCLAGPQAEARLVAQHFATVFDASTAQADFYLQHNFYFTAEEFHAYLQELPSHKALPAHCAPAPLWKLCSKDISSFATAKLGGCLHIGSFFQQWPEEWRTSYLCLLPKTDQVLDSVSKMRPISLLHPLGKSFAGLLMGRIKEDIVKRMEPYPQFAYLTGRSALDAIDRAFFHVCQTQARTGQQYTIHHRRAGFARPAMLGSVTLSVDLSRAFDSVSRSHIKTSLEWANIPESIIGVILGVHHAMILHYASSGSQSTTGTGQGIRQGCRLAPILWCCFTGWLLSKLTPLLSASDLASLITFFADDMLYQWEVSDVLQMQRVLRMIGFILDFLEHHGLQANLEKTVILAKFVGHQHTKSLVKKYGETP